ncbi:hypothetical protein GP475_00155 [Corynebacterium poyangense]|uniref:Uncharacterized protein n=1 Tax=Corynebacterium poyangense TaxID=2684405 RepID=A0A7H0SKZ0_9CORY|nr:hypothetical protein [Corynebacterium poyangense]MBZ8177299.1 hypothetical protein [Corynebacterium poyangense]QNQ89215.1 hypothetical protein GP475_00155 [Corynebacterium poyangense]
MNLSTIRLASSGVRTAWNTFNDYRQRKAVEAYDALSEAAGEIDLESLKDRGSDILQESRKEAGRVTQAARIRLSKALDTATEQGKDLAEQGKELLGQADKSSKKARKKAEKKAAKVRKKANKKFGRNQKGSWIGWVLALILGLVAGFVAWILFGKKDEAGTQPPRVEEYSSEEGEESHLVYSTTTPEGEDVKQEKVDPDEFLTSLDEQLHQHQESTGKHALIEDPQDRDDTK